MTLRGRLDPVLFGLAVVAAIPLVLFALGQIALNSAAPVDDPHASMAHYAGTTAAALGLALVAAMAAVRRVGSAIPRWTAAVGAFALGAASIIYPTQDSSFGLVWGVAAIAWAVAFALVGRRDTAGVDDGAP